MTAVTLYHSVGRRLGRMPRFAIVGAMGTVVNLAVLAALLGVGMYYLLAAVVAAEVSILHNFLMQERFVYRDMREASHAGWGGRAVMFFAFNNIEAMARIPVLALLVSSVGIHPVPAQALTLAAAFLLRFTFVSRVVYRPRVPAELTVPVRVEDYR